MSKFEAFMLLYKKFKAQQFSYDVDESFFWGNLSYFVDRFIDNENWNDMFNHINSLLEIRDLNEACYYISTFIIDCVLAESKLDKIPDFVIKLQKTRIEDAHKKNELDDIEIVSFQDFPEWFGEVSFAFDI